MSVNVLRSCERYGHLFDVITHDGYVYTVMDACRADPRIIGAMMQAGCLIGRSAWEEWP